MDKNIIKETMPSLEGRPSKAPREKDFDYARLDRSEPIVGAATERGLNFYAE
jgi:hypothetical protein